MGPEVRLETTDTNDGRQDFDFLFGEWRIANRKRANPLAEGDTEWQHFESRAVTRPIFGDQGNFDTYSARAFPGRGFFEGFALRLFQVDTGLWRIWWTSTASDGLLDPPLVGRFVDRQARFEGDDTIADRPLRVRFDWKNISPLSARWEQAFSFDEGASFETNWIMELTRVR